MTTVTIESKPGRLYAHLTLSRGNKGLASYLRGRGYRFETARGYWTVPQGDVEQLAQYLGVLRFPVVLLGEAA